MSLLQVRPDPNRANLEGWPPQIAETYRRADDLVATYIHNSSWPYATQLQWRAHTLDQIEGVVGACSVLLSLNTDLPDTHPRVSIFSEIPATESLRISWAEGCEATMTPCGTAPCETKEQAAPERTNLCILHRLPDSALTYAELALATDFQTVSVRSVAEQTAAIEWSLLSEFMEKGVIRRSQIHAAFLPRERDLELALECCAALEHSPLPLAV